MIKFGKSKGNGLGEISLIIDMKMSPEVVIKKFRNLIKCEKGPYPTTCGLGFLRGLSPLDLG